VSAAADVGLVHACCPGWRVAATLQPLVYPSRRLGFTRGVADMRAVARVWHKMRRTRSGSQELPGALA
jgi:hypothetical protein